MLFMLKYKYKSRKFQEANAHFLSHKQTFFVFFGLSVKGTLSSRRIQVIRRSCRNWGKVTAPFLPSLCMSLSEELVVCFHEEVNGLVSSILCCMIKNIWGCSMYITVGAARLILGKGCIMYVMDREWWCGDTHYV